MRVAAFLIVITGVGCGGAAGSASTGGASGNGGAGGSAQQAGQTGGGGTAGTAGGVGAGGSAGTSAGSGGSAGHPVDDAGVGGKLPDGGSLDPADARPVPPTGTVPMFVAAGQGGRTITSCDDGHTWIADHKFETANTDTVSTFTNKGLAYGQGVFMAMMAWDGNVSLNISDDGVNWARDQNLGGGYYGGVGWGGNTFVMIRNGNGGRAEFPQYSRDLGKTWVPVRTQLAPGFLREGGGGGDAVVGVFGGGAGQAVMSWDRGETWTVAPCPAMEFGGVGQFGGIAFAGGNLVYVAQDGVFCRVYDQGKSSSNGKLPGFPAGGRFEGKMLWLGDKFWAANGNSAFTSSDGASWSHVAFKPGNVAIWAMARGDSGTYVGVSGTSGNFYRSSDGITWQPATGPAGNPLWRVVFGWGKPSAMCP